MRKVMKSNTVGLKRIYCRADWRKWNLCDSENTWFPTEPIEHLRKQFDILDRLLGTVWSWVERIRKPDCGKNTVRKQKMSE